MNDLDCPEEISKLMRAFYARVAVDDLLAPVFVDQARVDWPKHIPRIAAFWCKLELGIPGFDGMPTQKHAALSDTIPFRAEQFGRWVSLFHETIDRGWRGPHSDSIKRRAESIARAQSRLLTSAEEWSPSSPDVETPTTHTPNH